MKHIVLVCTLLLSALGTMGQAKIEFQKTTHNFDTIVQGSDGRCTFTFRNTGNEPLIITGTSSSCGCTQPEYDARPVLPGEQGQIRVRYNTSLLGRFKKTIVVKSNAARQGTSLLCIKGFVSEKPRRKHHQ